MYSDVIERGAGWINVRTTVTNVPFTLPVLGRWTTLITTNQIPNFASNDAERAFFRRNRVSLASTLTATVGNEDFNSGSRLLGMCIHFGAYILFIQSFISRSCHCSG